jgi:hypothetical protein
MSGYYQIYIWEEDQVYTTFTTDWGTFAFRRMPFGPCNARRTFQRIMMDSFHDFLRHFLEVFIDNFGTQQEEGSYQAFKADFQEM